MQNIIRVVVGFLLLILSFGSIYGCAEYLDGIGQGFGQVGVAFLIVFLFIVGMQAIMAGLDISLGDNNKENGNKKESK